ncbi:MAG: hypothetical protein OEZ01_02830, partial [Candidatus Heimdallarchaeota archaeon]|nr:hypothetical protein [Candidatus Heimdallarchaeota archaeon]
MEKVQELFNEGKVFEALEKINIIEQNQTLKIENRLNILLIKSGYLQQIGNYSESLEIAKEILDNARKEGFTEIKIKAIITLADIFWNMGKLDDMFIYIEMGEIDLFKQINVINGRNSQIYYS